MKKRVIVLGVTGSIGRSTLDVIASHPDEFEAVALQAHKNEQALLEDSERFGVSRLCLSGTKPNSDRIAFRGTGGILRMIRETEADIVVNGISGSSGLLPSLAALESDKDLALANKETMVMAGDIAKRIAAKNKRSILPVDSEHSAVFHLVEAHGKSHLEEIILTASGGAFRDFPAAELEKVTVEDALEHPTWSMGQKITIDSATMANKGLEVIEAVRLFDIGADMVKTVIHPESKVHAFIRLTDGSLYAELSRSDMRLPIQDALTWPRLEPCPNARLELEGLTLSFRKPDSAKYPMLALAYECAGRLMAWPTVYNAANEIAVERFLSRQIRFTDIFRIVETVLFSAWDAPCETVEEVLETDKEARRAAEKAADSLSSR